MKSFVFDIEMFPNFFCATFMETESLEKTTFIIYKTINQTRELLAFLDREIQLIGFNNIHYDCPMLCYIQTHFESKTLLNELFSISTKLVSDEFGYDKELQKLIHPENIKYIQLDLMKIMAFDKLGISLKQTAINLGWYKIQDLPLPYNYKVSENEIDLIISYNINDVLITYELYKTITPQIQLRQELGKLFSVDLSSASDSKMANILLEKIYSDESGIDINTIKNLRTKREQFLISECLGNNIEFKTNKLKRVKQEIENILVRKTTNFSYKKTVEFGGVTYEMGIGGLHSVDDSKLFLSNDKIIVRDCDVSSYYPHIIIYNNIVPEHLNENFLDILKKITKERVEAKKLGLKTKAEALKITINSIFGKLGSNTFWLEDAKAMLSVTVSGQMYLLMLIESFILNGIRVISANTDGIVCLIPKELEEKYLNLCEEWQEKTHFELEFTDYSKYVRSDVNNYITQKADGKTKEKGRYVKEINLKAGYKYPIVARSLYEYFINNKSIEETMKECKNILLFCISQKTGKDFILEYHEEEKITELQKNNRFFVSNNGGKLIKRHKEKGNTIGIFVENNTIILNDYDKNIPFSEYDINYDFYINEAQKYIEKITIDDYSKVEFTDENEDNISNTEIDPEKEELLYKLSGIKNLSNAVVSNLLTLNREFKDNDFLKMLIYAEENNLLSNKFIDLIKINYFDKFGGNKMLLKMFEEFTKGKSRYNSKLTEKSKIKRIIELENIFLFIPNEPTTIQEQVLNELNIFGKVKSKFNVDKKYVCVLSLDTKYSPKVSVYTLKDGKETILKIDKRIFNAHPFNAGSIIFCKTFEKKLDKRKDPETDKWIDGETFSWWLTCYYIMQPNDKFLDIS